MTQQEKLVSRFLLKPKDFTWNELIKMMNSFGFEQISAGKTGGSRVRFVHDKHPPVILHKPHPGSILKRYQIDNILDYLKQEQLL